MSNDLLLIIYDFLPGTMFTNSDRRCRRYRKEVSCPLLYLIDTLTSACLDDSNCWPTLTYCLVLQHCSRMLCHFSRLYIPRALLSSRTDQLVEATLSSSATRTFFSGQPAKPSIHHGFPISAMPSAMHAR